MSQLAVDVAVVVDGHRKVVARIVATGVIVVDVVDVAVVVVGTYRVVDVVVVYVVVVVVSVVVDVVGSVVGVVDDDGIGCGDRTMG